MKGRVAAYWRSIPASAGEPAVGFAVSGSSPVYPRECGEPRGQNGGTEVTRSIPASAGEPGCDHIELEDESVYPRECGEPYSPSRITVKGRVYPRECGGTFGLSSCALVCYGLSPRVRGNLPSLTTHNVLTRSIPASAGEPTDAHHHQNRHQVYPRECGGTSFVLLTTLFIFGLSPRVRGNHVVGVRDVCHRGSIPASAGEPTIRSQSDYERRVYPRECGGTLTIGAHRHHAYGLSPRVRGNRW